MLTGTALNFVNHLLGGEAWARTRLEPFAGQTACLSLGALMLPVTITNAGLFEPGKRTVCAAVTITLPADAPLRALTDRPSLFAAAHITGSAELAEALGFIFRNLCWDAEDDLARLIGDVAARRVLLGGRQFVQWHRQRAKNFALNVAEYLTEESPAIARRTDIAHFCRAVDNVRDDCARIEKRMRNMGIR